MLEQLPIEEFQQRRAALLRQLPKGSVAIVAAASEKTRSNDTEYPFRQNSDFFYLTGFNEPDALLLLANDAEQPVQLFCHDKDPQVEVWHGLRLGVENAVEQLGVDVAYSLDDIDSHLPELLNGSERVLILRGEEDQPELQLSYWLHSVREKARQGYQAPPIVEDLAPYLHNMRRSKSAGEQRMMRRAADISVAAFKRAMQFAKPGRYEFQVAAELHHAFAMEGAHQPAYGTICAGGANACVLHYTDNKDRLQDGDLLLIDAGGEYQGYAADITRTFPVNGRFTEPQRQLYQWVLDAQLAAIEVLRPGATLQQATDAAAKVLNRGLTQLGILDGDEQQNYEQKRWRKYFIHGLGHWLGLDVHDRGDYRNNGSNVKLAAGMVLTVEPGLYIPADAEVEEQWRDIGIRIEDDILITANGHENLTAALPKTVEDIEAWLAQGQN
ncbi:Xaa-Pro aminopeptidase [Idiomarina tyrosinivorans]|uniref:Xaa-Pro aminopeptidase n=1 Tax=Idiomarina tyrosinivorans TaxID=1445662 RepID=A0A432ZSG7_9GAMM|nr:Xaa-Pro aminopeptidase [Idiomarina tyrosinivorans]RUO80802.1 Xaa-Pro aminopeptidase [Idiomarina tyrosinivorans]